MTHVLVVDDNDDTRYLTSLVFDNEGAQVREADSASSAWRHVEWADAVVIDLMMPGLNGADFAQLLKATHPELRVYIVTAAGPPSFVIDMYPELDGIVDGIFTKGSYVVSDLVAEVLR